MVPHVIVADQLTLEESLSIAFLQRPELSERRVAVARGLLALESARVLPFSPNLFIGYSMGGFGGGSNLVSDPVGTTPFARGEAAFGNFAARQDLDVMAYWWLQNLGVGNRALKDAAASRLRTVRWEEIVVLEQVRKEVAVAMRESRIRLRKIELGEKALAAAELAFKEDLGGPGLRKGCPLKC